MKLTQLLTPALVVDERAMLENMDAMDRILAGKALRLRPHFKSHKCSEIAHMQVERGAVGITCAKLSEAEDLIDSGITDVLIANQIVGEDKLLRAAQLARMCRLTVCVDSADNAKALSEAAQKIGSTIGCLVELDIGMQRCGVCSFAEYIQLAEQIVRLPNLEYRGIQAYAGHISHMQSQQARIAETRQNEATIRALIDALRDVGIAASIVSGGSTGTAEIKASGGLYTELQAGSYFLLDNTYNKLDLPFRNALFVLATVISCREHLAVLDVGVKGLGVDQDAPAVRRLNGEEVFARTEANEEHLKLFDPSVRLSVGEKVLVTPGHCCSTVNLYDRMYLFRGDFVIDRLNITARGKSQ